MKFQASDLSTLSGFQDWWEGKEGYVPDAVPIFGTWGKAKESTAQAAGAASELVPTAFAEHFQVALAYASVPAGEAEFDAAYTSEFKKTPASVLDAYEQAIFWLSFAARRASYHDQGASAAALKKASGALQVEWNEVSSKLGWICTASGYQCPRGGSAAVLTYAITAIEEARPPDEDRILAVLKGSRRAVMIRKAIPLVTAVALGAVVGTWWYRRQTR